MAEPPARIDQTGGGDPAASMPDTAAAAAPAPAPESSSTVLCTIMDNEDGTYTLLKGDEDEGGGAAEGGAAAAAGGGLDAGAAGAAAQGQTFDSPGALLKGILDILKGQVEDDSGDGSDFDEGFKGGSNVSPAKQPMTPGEKF